MSYGGDGNALVALQRHMLNGGSTAEIVAHLEAEPGSQYRDVNRFATMHAGALSRIEATPGANC